MSLLDFPPMFGEYIYLPQGAPNTVLGSAQTDLVACLFQHRKGLGCPFHNFCKCGFLATHNLLQVIYKYIIRPYPKIESWGSPLLRKLPVYTYLVPPNYLYCKFQLPQSLLNSRIWSAGSTCQQLLCPPRHKHAIKHICSTQGASSTSREMCLPPNTASWKWGGGWNGGGRGCFWIGGGQNGDGSDPGGGRIVRAGFCCILSSLPGLNILHVAVQPCVSELADANLSSPITGCSITGVKGTNISLSQGDPQSPQGRLDRIALPETLMRGLHLKLFGSSNKQIRSSVCFLKISKQQNVPVQKSCWFIFSSTCCTF